MEAWWRWSVPCVLYSGCDLFFPWLQCGKTHALLSSSVIRQSVLMLLIRGCSCCELNCALLPNESLDGPVKPLGAGLGWREWERHTTRNFPTRIKTTAIAYGRKIARSLKILPICNGSRFYKRQGVMIRVLLGRSPTMTKDFTSAAPLPSPILCHTVCASWILSGPELPCLPARSLVDPSHG